MIIAIVMLVIALVALLCLALLASDRKASFWSASSRGELSAVNIASGTHENGRVSRYADAAFAARYLLCKVGSDATHIAVNGADDDPLGVNIDEADAAEDLNGVQLLGPGAGTVLMVPSESITAGSRVYTAASGKIQDLPAAAGTYYLVGRILEAGVADVPAEVAPCFPVATVVSE